MAVPALFYDLGVSTNQRADQLELCGLGVDQLDPVTLEAENEVAGGRGRVRLAELEFFNVGWANAGPSATVRCAHQSTNMYAFNAKKNKAIIFENYLHFLEQDKN